MQSTQTSGKTVDEAIRLALEELGITQEQAQIEILSEGSKGLFGIGSKPAQVIVSCVQPENPLLVDFLSGLCERMGVPAKVEVEDTPVCYNVRLSGDNMGALIGHRGETLDMIQYLTNLVVNRNAKNYKRVLIDIENYRKKRSETLVRLAHRLAQKCKTTGRNVALEPMNPYERRILHAALQDDPDVMTHSEGEEPNRRVIITRKR